jgi:phosphate transport system substrate-binding protein
MQFHRIGIIVFFVCASIAAGCTSAGPGPPAPNTLRGAGSTFDTPFFSKAFARYTQTSGVRVDYASVGSSVGVHEFTNGGVDFGATDIPMTASELAAYPGGAAGVVQLPIALGGVVIAYNVPGLSDAYIPHRIHLRLTPDVLGKIFSGTITSWSDPEIAASNPGAKLPSLPIDVVNQADSAGTTSVFMDYLKDSSPSWSAYALRHRTGWGAASTLGMIHKIDVAAKILNSRGSIGYVEMATVIGTKANYAAIRNRAGNFVLPSMLTVRAAAAQQPTISPSGFYIDDLGGPNSYPIAGYSWLLIRRSDPDAVRGAAICSFARWMLTEGQKVAPSVGYVPLPANLANRALAVLGSCSGGT